MSATGQPMPDDGQRTRQAAMALFAKATRDELQEAWDAILKKPDVSPVRGPETGLVMVRGRIGGGGAPFNLGEVTVTRASVRLSGLAVGHGQALGTDRRKAQLAAIFDALRQMPEFSAHAERLTSAVTERVEAEDREAARQTAATRVDFFTMVRGED